MTYLEELTNTRLKQPHTLAEGIPSSILNIRKESIKQSLGGIQMVGHRQSYVATVDGVMYYDDSKAENVNATWFTFENIVNPVVWIAGCDDHKADFSELKSAARKNVRALICLGNDSRHLRSTFKSDVKLIYDAESIETAVYIASQLAKENDVVLFSPGCRAAKGSTSNEERGDQYIASVKKLGE